MNCKFGHTHQHVKQLTDETCSTACVEIVCKRLGRDLEYSGFQTNFYNAFKSEHKPGLTHEPIVKIFSGLGIQAVAYVNRSFNLGALVYSGFVKLPMIVEVAWMKKQGDAALHWVVLDGHKENEFCVLDPSQDKILYTNVPKKGDANYTIADGRVFLFTGRAVMLVS